MKASLHFFRLFVCASVLIFPASAKAKDATLEKLGDAAIYRAVTNRMADHEKTVFENIRAGVADTGIDFLGGVLKKLEDREERAVVIYELERFATSHVPGLDAKKSLQAVQTAREILRQHDIDPKATTGRWDFDTKFRRINKAAATAYARAGTLYQKAKVEGLSRAEQAELDGCEVVLQTIDSSKKLLLQSASLAAWSPQRPVPVGSRNDLYSELVAVVDAYGELTDTLQGKGTLADLARVVEKSQALGGKIENAYEKGGKILEGLANEADTNYRNAVAGINSELFSKPIDFNGDGRADAMLEGVAIRDVTGGEIIYDPFLLAELPKLAKMSTETIGNEAYRQFKIEADAAYSQRNTQTLDPLENPFTGEQASGRYFNLYGREGRPDIEGEVPTHDTETAETTYRQFQLAAYGNRSRSYSDMVDYRGGFGGVIFGNEVGGADNPVKSIHWRQDTKNGYFGDLVLVTDANNEFVLPRVTMEDAYAAWRIVFKQSGGWTEGEGLGLVGIFNRQSCVWADKNLFKDLGGWFGVVMHPAIINTDLGWSALMVDAGPIADKALVKLVEAHSGSANARKVAAFFSQEALGTWKITDVPVSIRLSRSRIMVENTKTQSADYFLTLVPFPMDSSEKPSVSWRNTYTRGFEETLPFLVKSSADFEHVNRFAKIFAVFRYAKSRGAQYPENYAIPKPPGTGLKTPLGVKVFDEGVLPSSPPPVDKTTVRSGSRLEVYKALAGLRGDDNLAHNNDFKEKALKMTALRRKLEEIHSEIEGEDFSDAVDKLSQAERQAVVPAIIKYQKDEISSRGLLAAVKSVLRHSSSSAAKKVISHIEYQSVLDEIKEYTSLFDADFNDVLKWLRVLDLIEQDKL
ncbi:MAG: hypothetical protein RRC34_05185 [Lentisphaeria bacterium]|nr:hypothetical protein [Lentisphaeria bacterium]